MARPHARRAVRNLEHAQAVVSGTIAADGNPVNVTISNVGDTASLTFTETPGHYFYLEFSGGFYYYSAVAVYDANGGAPVASADFGSQYIDRTLLPTQGSGTYTITLAPHSSTPTGTATFTLFDVPADYTGTIATDGTAAPVVISTPGQRGYLTFQGTAGTNIFIGFGSGFYYYSRVVLVNPDLSTQSVDFGPGYMGRTPLTQTGPYQVWLYPDECPCAGSPTGQTTFQIWQVPDDNSGSIAIGGSATMTIGTPGQRAYRTFYATAGTPVSASWDNSVFYYYSRVYLDGPNGNIVNQTYGLGSFPSTVLPVSGVYRIFLDPSEAAAGQRTGSVTFHLNQGTAYEPLAQTYGPADGGLDAVNQTDSFDDVNTLSGAYTTQATDASMSAIGVSFNFGRSYTSAIATGGRLGPGWSDSYSAAIAVQPSGDALLTNEGGQQIYFAKQADGSFVGPVGAVSTLSAVSGGYQLLNNDQTKLSFDSNGRLTSIKDRNNEGVTLAYDGSGNLQTVTDSVGRAVTFTPNADGTLQKLTLPDGRHVDYGYTNGRLTSVTLPDPDGGGPLTSPVWHYSYDANGLLATVQNPNLHTVITNHYTNGRIDTQTDALGKQTLFSWDDVNQTELVTDPNGHVWKDVYQNNMLIKKIDPLGNTISYGYDSNDNLTSTQDARLNTTSMTYDAHHNMLARTAPSPFNYAESWTYNAFNDPLTYTDGRGNGVTASCPAAHTTCYGYDAAGNLTNKTLPDPDGAGPLAAPVVQYGRDPAGTGLLVSQTDPNNRTTSYGHDNQGNLTAVTLPLGEKTTMVYDSVGRMTSRVDGRGNVAGCGCAASHTTTFAYDGEDHLISETDPGMPAKTWTYDGAGNLTRVTDQNGHHIDYAHDSDERLSSVTAADGTSATRYDYDNAGNLYHRTDPNNHITTYGYDTANRLTSISLPPITTPSAYTPVWTYGYDASGNRTAVLNPNGATTTTTFDQMNRPTQVSYSGGATTPTIGYTYDADSNRTQLTDGDGTATYAYDNDNQLTSVSRAHSGGGTDTFSYGYDPVGNITSRTYPDNTVVNYAPDNDERLHSVTVGSAATSYGYDAASNLTATTTPDSYTETRGYDNANRETSIVTKAGSTTLATFTYTLDSVGNATAVTGTNPALYSYDARDELTSVCFQTTTCTRKTDPYIGWTYDGVGNRKTETRGVGGTVTTSTYNEDDELLSAGSTSYSYDHNGNQTQAGTRTFGYDAANRLVSTTSGSTTDTYSYDGDGNRLTDALGATTTKYVWDTNNPLVQLALERDGSNNLIRRYTFGADTIGFATPSSSFYYHYDRIGSVVNVTNATGVKQWTYSYEPFGTARTATSVNGAPANPLRFDGEYLDSTGLYNLRAREYDPTSGRFLGVDPMPAGISSPYGGTYDYADENPINGYDPSGESTWPMPRVGVGWGLGALFAISGGCAANPAACNSGSSIIIKKIADAVRGATKPRPSAFPPDFNDPSKGPDGWIPRGKDPGGGKGGYVNPDNPDESWHPDLGHGPPIGGHWDHNHRPHPKTRYGPGWKKQ